MNREKQQKLAAQCIKELTERYRLNPNLLKYFLEGKVYYTEEIIPYCVASMDNITYDQKYVDIVREFEEKSGALVYHAILKGSFFCMLYIGSAEDVWLSSFPADGFDLIISAVYDITTGKLSLGYIAISAVGGTMICTS